MTKAAIAAIKKSLTGIFAAHANIAPGVTARLLPKKAYQGKLYEASVLANICMHLNIAEGCTISLQRGSSVRFKQKGTHLNRAKPYFLVNDRHGTHMGEIHLNTYFEGVSKHTIPGNSAPGDYHELDIVMIRPNVTGNVTHQDVLLAVEAKNTVIQKSTIRELLGFRRELSFLTANQSTAFATWPTNLIPANPNSVHLLYTSDNTAIGDYQNNCNIFGTMIIHHTM